MRVDWLYIALASVQLSTVMNIEQTSGFEKDWKFLRWLNDNELFTKSHPKSQSNFTVNVNIIFLTLIRNLVLC